MEKPAHLLRERTARALLGLCGLFLLAGFCRGQDLPVPLQEVFRAGVAAQKAGRLEEAAKAFERVLREGGKVAYVYNNLGIVYQQRGEQTLAIAQFREAIRLQPDYAAPRILLGASLLVTGHAMEATDQLERAVKLLPGEPLARLELAKAYDRIGNVNGVTEQYRALRKLDPQNPEYTYQLGRAYLKQAQESFARIRRLKPDSPRVYQILADAARAQGHSEFAIRAYRRALQADPKLPGLHLALAQIYLDLGQTANAEHEIGLELAIVPESTAAQALREKISAHPSKP
jgi:tetratricopeptide (TPR) repeat protein